MRCEKQVFTAIELPALLASAQAYERSGARFVQCCAAPGADAAGTDGAGADGALELTYSFDTGAALENLHVTAVPGDEIPSITSLFPAAFVFENEMHDLYGISVSGISVDFAGKFYTVATPSPMTSDTAAFEARGEERS